MFENGVYTDVTAEESVSGAPGFNYQAVSPGFDGALQRTARERLLHRVSDLWGPSQDPLSHPETFAFERIDDALLLSRGRSTGVTLNGRSGNQLTHVVATQDPHDLAPHRPAQLFGAAPWLREKADSSSVEPWDTPVEISEDFEPDGLLAWAAADSWVMSVLPTLLTMLEESAGGDTAPITVVVAEDLTDVARVIALGTMLLDQESALRLSFRAFVDDPWRAGTRVVGMRPDFGSIPETGAQVFDLLHRTTTPVAVSASALQTAQWLEDHDETDVLELVEVAHQLRPHLPTETWSEASEFVLGLDDLDPAGQWDVALHLVEGLAPADRFDLLEEHMDAIADGVAMHRPRTVDDFVRAARGARLSTQVNDGELARCILRPAMETLPLPENAPLITGWARELRAGGGWAWPPDPEGDIRARMGSILAEAPGEAVPDLMALARPMEDQFDDHEIAGLVRNAARLLRERPALLPDSRGWIRSESIRAGLRREVADGFLSADPVVTQGVERGVWDDLAQGEDDDARRLRRILAARDLRRDLLEAQGSKKSAAVRLVEESAPMDPGMWRYVFGWSGDQAPDRHEPEAYAAWLRVQGGGAGFKQHLIGLLQHRLGPDQDPTKELNRWKPVLAALEELPGSDDDTIALLREDFDAMAEKIPSLKGVVRGVLRRPRTSENDPAAAESASEPAAGPAPAPRTAERRSNRPRHAAD